MKYLLFLYLLLATAGTMAQKNTAAQVDKPYVILISCDGYRHDYTERFQPPNISRFIAEGVQASSMISSYPSKTFPNHYTIATGLYPEHHGLVNNTFYDPEREEMYRISRREAVQDGSWYSGTPLWVNAEQNGMVAASYFFVGSEADIQGVRPSYYYDYDGSVPNEERVNQVLRWLQLPEEQRPHMITLYFSDMDDAGHRYGPNNEVNIRSALMALDTVLGQLFDGVKQSGLPVNIIMVSDHGMVDVPAQQLINIDPLEREDMYRIANNGALAHVYLEEGADEKEAYQFLKSREEHFTVYRVGEFPYYLSCEKSPRLGQFILLPDYGYYLSNSRKIGLAERGLYKQGGEHGFHPEFPDMHAIFYANGPAFKQAFTFPSFRNVHVYPLICHILGLPIPEGIDGQLEVLQGTLR